MVVSETSLELRRRLTGMNFVQLAAAAGISYKRLRRFFKEGGPLTLNEIERLSSLLDAETTPVAAVAVSGNTPINGTEARA